MLLLYYTIIINIIITIIKNEKIRVQGHFT